MFQAVGVMEQQRWRSRVYHLQLPRCLIEDAEEFYRLLREKLPEGTQMFGSKECHKATGTSLYHVVIGFPERTRYVDANKKFTLILEDKRLGVESISVTTQKRGEDEREFLRKVQAYCARDDGVEVFGERIISGGDGNRLCVDCGQEFGSREHRLCLRCTIREAMESLNGRGKESGSEVRKKEGRDDRCAFWFLSEEGMVRLVVDA